MKLSRVAGVLVILSVAGLAAGSVGGPFVANAVVVSSQESQKDDEDSETPDGGLDEPSAEKVDVVAGDLSDWAYAKGYKDGVSMAIERPSTIAVYHRDPLVPDLIARLAEIDADPSISVVVHQTPYARDELQAEALRIAKEYRVGVSVRFDLAGLNLFPTESNVRDAELVRSEYPTFIVEGSGLGGQIMDASTSGSRLHDLSPFFGGNLITRANGSGICSTGFAMVSGSVSKMLTARHCGTNTAWYSYGNSGGGANPPASPYEGTTGTGSQYKDAVLFSGSGLAYGPQIF